MTTISGRTTFFLEGLDGSNPLAFLASVGILRTAALAEPSCSPSISWSVASGGLRPTLALVGTVGQAEFLERVHEFLQTRKNDAAFTRWHNLGVPVMEYREYENEAALAATALDRAWADFATAFGSDGVTTRDAKKNLVIEDTAFRTVSGAGHQHFLGTMRNVIAVTTADHLSRTLFAPWDYADPMPNNTLRWDPADDARHALQWRSPSGDPARNIGGTMVGATRLAIEGLPLFPTMPNGARLQTTGFSGTGRRNTFFTWPIWDGAIGMDTCRSLLAMDALQSTVPDAPHLRERGIVAVYRSQRITEGKYRNFTPARRVG